MQYRRALPPDESRGIWLLVLILFIYVRRHSPPWLAGVMPSSLRRKRLCEGDPDHSNTAWSPLVMVNIEEVGVI